MTHLIRCSRIRLMVDLFGCGSSLNITRRASILADSFELLNWLNVSKNWNWKSKSQEPFMSSMQVWLQSPPEIVPFGNVDR